jgi:hypothetical protein
MNSIRSVEAAQLTDFLIHQTHIPTDAVLAQKAEVLVRLLAHRIPLWEMYCNKELQAAELAYATMSSADRY